jgi:hypothetical protein
MGPSPQPQGALVNLLVIVPELHGIPAGLWERTVFEPEDNAELVQRTVSGEVKLSGTRTEQWLLVLSVGVRYPDLCDPFAVTLGQHQVHAQHRANEGEWRIFQGLDAAHQAINVDAGRPIRVHSHVIAEKHVQGHRCHSKPPALLESLPYRVPKGYCNHRHGPRQEEECWGRRGAIPCSNSDCGSWRQGESGIGVFTLP